MTAEEAGYKVTNTDFDYFAAGKRSQNYTEDQADLAFDSIARQHGVKEGPYGSWDMFWLGYLEG